MYKSYGIYGSTTQPLERMRGYLSNYTDMFDTRSKYIMVSVWANDNTAAIPAAGEFEINFTSGTWGIYHETIWALPVTPAGAPDPRVPNALNASILNYNFALLLFGFVYIINT